MMGNCIGGQKKKDDAQMQELHGPVLEEAEEEKVAETNPTSEEKDASFARLYELQPPTSESIVTFREVYQTSGGAFAPLAQFYKIESASTPLVSGQLATIEDIDYRPQSWYAALEALANEARDLRVIKKEKERLKSQVEHEWSRQTTDEKGSPQPISEQVAISNSLLLRFNNLRQELLNLQQTLALNEKRRSQIMADIRASQYVVKGHVVEKSEESMASQSRPDFIRPGIFLEAPQFTINKILKPQVDFLQKAYEKDVNLSDAADEKQLPWKSYENEIKTVMDKTPAFQQPSAENAEKTIAPIWEEKLKQVSEFSKNPYLVKMQQQLLTQIDKTSAEITRIQTRIKENAELRTEIERLPVPSAPPEESAIRRAVEEQLKRLPDQGKRRPPVYPILPTNQAAAQESKEVAEALRTKEAVQAGRMREAMAELTSLQKDLKTQQNNLGSLKNSLTELQKSGLKNRRVKFLQEFNRVMNAGRVKVVPREGDALNDYMRSLEQREEQESEITVIDPQEIMIFTVTPEGIFNQHRQTLQEVLALDRFYANEVLILPKLNAQGQLYENLYQAVTNFVGVHGRQLRPPVIKVVETMEVARQWTGYCTANIGQILNLTPGESRTYSTETQTELTRRIATNRTDESSQQQQASSSFEDNLQTELAGEVMTTASSEREQKREQAQQLSQEQSQEQSQSTENEQSASNTITWEAQASGGFAGIFKASAKAGGEHSFGSRNQVTAASTSRHAAQDALSASQSASGRELTGQNRTSTHKNVAGAIKKVAAATSAENKLLFTTTSSEDFQAKTTSKETRTITNTNVGANVDIMLFQAQNKYDITTKLADGKIIVDTGIEPIPGTGITYLKVYELEGFNRVYRDLLSTQMANEAQAKAIALLVIKNVLQNYWYPNNPDSILSAQIDEATITTIVEFSGVLNAPLNNPEDADRITSVLETGLRTFENIEFTLCPAVIEKTEVVINAPSFITDIRLSMHEASEEFLKERQGTDLEKQRADIARINAHTEHQRARTRHGVFSNIELPSSATHVAMSMFSPRDRAAAHSAQQDDMKIAASSQFS